MPRMPVRQSSALEVAHAACDTMHMWTCVDGYYGPYSRHGSWLLPWSPTLDMLPVLLNPDGWRKRA